MDSLGFTNCPIQLRFNTVPFGGGKQRPSGGKVGVPRMFRAPPVAWPRRLGDSAGCVGRLRLVPGWPERDNRILEAATKSPSAVFDACGARALPGRTAEVAQEPYPF